MRKASFILFLLSLNAYSADDCRMITELQLKMDAHASNYLNAETTRTPDGGPYQYKKVVCNGACKIKQQKAFFQKYDPGHPDADTSGYVVFPHIDKNIEKAFISSFAKSLVMIAKECPSHAKVMEIENGPSALMTFRSGSIASDSINFSSKGDVISWVRTTREGGTRILNL